MPADPRDRSAVATIPPPKEPLPDVGTMIAELYVNMKRSESDLANFKAQLSAVVSNQQLVTDSAAKIEGYHRDVKDSLVRFIDRIDDVYQRQTELQLRMGQIEAWQKLHGDERGYVNGNLGGKPDT